MSIPLRIHGTRHRHLQRRELLFQKRPSRAPLSGAAQKSRWMPSARSGRSPKDCVVEFSGTPAGTIRTADLAGPNAISAVRILAKSIFGNSDTPLVVQTINDGAAITCVLRGGGISKYAPILLSDNAGDALQGRHDVCLPDGERFQRHQRDRVEKHHFERILRYDVRSFQSPDGRNTWPAWGSASPYNAMIAEEGFTLTPFHRHAEYLGG